MNSWVLGRVLKESQEIWGIPIFWRLVPKRDVSFSITHLLVPINSRVLDCTYLSVDPICVPSIFTCFGMRPCSKVTQLARNQHHLIKPPC